MSWLVALLLGAFVEGNDRMVIHFVKDDCAPCKQTQPAIDQLRQEGWTVRTVNTDREPLLVRKFAIQSVPTMVFVSGGREADRIVGAAPIEQIQKRVAAVFNATGLSRTSNPKAATDPTTHSSVQAPQLLSSQNRTPAPAESPTVRGQSPALGAFPMLDASAPVRPAFNQLASATASTAASLAGTADQLRNELEDRGQQILEQAAEIPQIASRAIERSRDNSVVQAIAAGIAPRPGVIPTEGVDLQKAISRAQAATVRIRVEEQNTLAFGTGTVIDVRGNEALVLTCGHLFRDMKDQSTLSIDVYSGPSQSTNVKAVYVHHKIDNGAPDVGFLSFALPFPIEPVPLIPRSQRLAIQQAVFSFGCDHGQNPTRHDTKVKSINRYLGPKNLEIEGAPAVGRSGGGLFDTAGRLVGVCNAAEPTGNSGIYLSADEIYAQLEALGQPHLIPDHNGESPVALAGGAAPSGNAAADFMVVPATQNLPRQIPARSSPANVRWPDEQVTSIRSAPGNSAGAPVRGSDGGSLTCIVRDANGQEQVIRIASPSAEILNALQQAATR